MDQRRSRPLSRNITVPQRLLAAGGHRVHFNNTDASRALCGACPVFGEPSRAWEGALIVLLLDGSRAAGKCMNSEITEEISKFG